jgi:MFS family permease
VRRDAGDCAPGGPTSPNPLGLETASGGMRRLLTILIPFALGFLISNLYRSVNAVIAPSLSADLALNPTDLGFLAGVYFLASAACQLPLGSVLDRFGPFNAQVGLLAAAALGCLVFALSDRFELLVLARLMMGAGAAGGLMVAFNAVVLWYPAERRPLTNSFVLTAGGLGAIIATTPIDFLLRFADWRGIFVIFAGLTIFIAVYTAVAGRGWPYAAQQPVDTTRPTEGFATVWSDPVFWRIAPIAATTMGVSLAFQGLWAGPWLRDVAGFSSDAIARGLFVMAVAMTAGFLVTGFIAQVASRRGVSLAFVVCICVALLLVSQLAMVLGWRAGTWLVLIGTGLFSNSAVLCYPLLALRFPKHLIGRANALQNLLFFAVTFAAQGGIGFVIDLSPTLATGGYRPESYQAAMGILLILEFAAFVWFALAPAHSFGTRSSPT